MMMTNVNGAAAFILNAPQEYFADTQSLALLSAALEGNLAKAQQLVAAGANPNDEGPRDNQYNRLRLIHYAIAANNGRAVKILMAAGSNPELDAEGFGSAFLFAMTLQNMEILSQMLDARPIDTLSKDTLEDILFQSVSRPCRKCLELFLKQGAPIEFPDGSGYTMLMRAIDAQDYELAEWLLQQGASVHVESNGGMTPAYSVQYDLQKFKLGTPTYNKVLHLKSLMEARGAVFPALSPKQVKARRATTGK